MPSAPRPKDAEATRIAYRILGRNQPKTGPKNVPKLIGPQIPTKAFDGQLG